MDKRKVQGTGLRAQGIKTLNINKRKAQGTGLKAQGIKTLNIKKRAEPSGSALQGDRPAV